MMTKKELLAESGVPRQTLERWLRQKKIIPADFDSDGLPLFAPEQIQQAKSLHRPDLYHRHPAQIKNAPAESLFEGVDTSDVDEKISVTPAPQDESQPTVISGEAYRTILLHVEKISGGQFDASSALKSELRELFRVDATDLVKDIVSDLQKARDTALKFLSTLCFTVEDNNARYRLVGRDLELISTDTASANQIVTIEHAPDVEGTLEARAARIRQLQADVQRGIIAIGLELIEAKKLIGHGGWAEWLKKEFAWTQQTANRFMRVAERFGKLNNVVQFQPSTLQAMLALPAGEEEEFIAAQADAGRPVESQSAREVQRNVEVWNKRGEVCGEYLNVTGAEKNNAVVDELNHALATQNSAGRAESFSFSREQDADENFSLTPDEPPDDMPMTSAQAFSYHTGNPRWGTPAQYVEAARQVMQTIDLDPASEPQANEIVRATKFFTADDNGLAQEWSGRIWLNPPYTTDPNKGATIIQFVDKLLAEYDVGNVTEAVVLTYNSTQTAWFNKLAEASAAIVFTDHRINFYPLDADRELKSSSARFGQAFFYFGYDPDKFYRVFRQFGWGCKFIADDKPREKEEGGLFNDFRLDS